MMNEPMTSKRFILIFASIFLLGSMPLLISQPNGASSAGLSAGFTLPIEKFPHALVFLALGIYACLLRGNAQILLPLSFVLLYVVGMMSGLDQQRYPMIPVFLFGTIILFALSLAVAEQRRFVVGMLLSASIGFHFGTYYNGIIPAIASPIYFMLGNILSFALIFAVAISLGVALRQEPDTSVA